MIELFDRIKLFNNKYFGVLIKNDSLGDFLQDYADFIAKQNNTKNYKILFSNEMKNDIARFRIRKNECLIELNKNILEWYKKYINNPDLDIFKQKMNGNITFGEQLSRFPYQICSSITHEMKHAKQYEEYIINKKDEYKNIITPLTQDEVYAIQKTEREAYTHELEEINCLIDYFRTQNIDTKNLETYYNLTKIDFEDMFDLCVNMLKEAKIIKETITPDTIEANIKIYKKISDFLDRETSFSKERQDHIRNKDDYIIKNIAFNNNNVKLYLKNDNMHWNIYLESTNFECGFTLDNNKLRINTLTAIDSNTEKEALKYIKVFTEMYSSTKDFTKHEVSDLLDFNRYKTSKELIKRNTGITHKIKLPGQTQDIKKLYNILVNIFSIEEKTIIYKSNIDSDVNKNIDTR